MGSREVRGVRASCGVTNAPDTPGLDAPASVHDARLTEHAERPIVRDEALFRYASYNWERTGSKTCSARTEVVSA